MESIPVLLKLLFGIQSGEIQHKKMANFSSITCMVSAWSTKQTVLSLHLFTILHTLQNKIQNTKRNH